MCSAKCLTKSSFVRTPAASLNRMWFAGGVESSPYTMVDVIRIDGVYDFGAMQRTMSALVARHSLLRTGASASAGRSLQTTALPECDLTVLPDEEREAAWRCLVREQGRQTIERAGAPLFRLMMIHVAPEEHRLLLTIHRIIADEWSTAMIQQEMRQLYEAFSHGLASPLAE